MRPEGRHRGDTYNPDIRQQGSGAPILQRSGRTLTGARLMTLLAVDFARRLLAVEVATQAGGGEQAGAGKQHGSGDGDDIRLS
jgi:hypothetical protein